MKKNDDGSILNNRFKKSEDIESVDNRRLTKKDDQKGFKPGVITGRSCPSELGAIANGRAAAKESIRRKRCSMDSSYFRPRDKAIPDNLKKKAERERKRREIPGKISILQANFPKIFKFPLYRAVFIKLIPQYMAGIQFVRNNGNIYYVYVSYQNRKKKSKRQANFMKPKLRFLKERFDNITTIKIKK